MAAHIDWISPLALLAVLAVWGGLIKKLCPFKKPASPVWPYAANPGLALELAASPQDLDNALGPPGDPVRAKNIASAQLFQYLDFVFIPLYAGFFILMAWRLSAAPWFWAAFVLAAATAIFDILEDLAILNMLKGRPDSARRFGRLKWVFYFATLGIEGALLLGKPPLAFNGPVAAIVLGVLLLLTAVGGIWSSVRASFTGIMTGGKVSSLGLLALALVPAIENFWAPDGSTAACMMLIRVPLLIGGLLAALPLVAFFTGARSLLRGLFDLTPLSLLVVTFAALALAGTVSSTAWLALAHADRVGLDAIRDAAMPSTVGWLLIVAFLAAPVVLFALVFSIRQSRFAARLEAGDRSDEPRGPVWYILAVAAGIVITLGFAWILIDHGSGIMTAILPDGLAHAQVPHRWANNPLFKGYLVPANSTQPDPWPDHLNAMAAFLATFLLYIGTGIYGWVMLGKRHTVPALGSALLLLMMIEWGIAGVAFFFDPWHVPTLLIIVAIGAFAAQSTKSDHYYNLLKPSSAAAAPDPAATITATNRTRVLVVAANGGGIQASAWAAQVLEGLTREHSQSFVDALRLISSVSGGSVGAASYVASLAQPGSNRPPSEAAAQSSLDEVAWGLAWPDFVRAIVPWISGHLIGRGRALEKAWRMNCGLKCLDAPLSAWNNEVAGGRLPAVLLNATIAESGERLLLATTQFDKPNARGKARVDATELHTINGEQKDVRVVTGARLSATFPYVTPASRSNGPGPQPHVVDGGYYDNFGMASLVEWLDEALAGAQGRIESVLVIQIHGVRVGSPGPDQRYSKSRGWFYQAIVPVTTLAAVRDSGQVAHNDNELELLQAKWAAKGVQIYSVPFEFPSFRAPLSWHLTPEEIGKIRSEWKSSDLDPARDCVGRFLAGLRV